MFKLYLIIHVSTTQRPKRRRFSQERSSFTFIEHARAHIFLFRKKERQTDRKWQMRCLRVHVSGPHISSWFVFQFGYSRFSTDSSRSGPILFVSDFPFCFCIFNLILFGFGRGCRVYPPSHIHRVFQSKHFHEKINHHPHIAHIDHYYVLAVEESVKFITCIYN